MTALAKQVWCPVERRRSGRAAGLVQRRLWHGGVDIEQGGKDGVRKTRASGEVFGGRGVSEFYVAEVWTPRNHPQLCIRFSGIQTRGLVRWRMGRHVG